MQRELGAAAFEPFVQMDMGAEDFAYFVAAEHGVPGYYFAVGGTPQADIDAAANGGPAVAGHHSPLFKVAPRESVVLGTRAMVAAVLDLAPVKRDVPRNVSRETLRLQHRKGRCDHSQRPFYCNLGRV